MDLLLDTHALLWFTAGSAELSAAAESAIESRQNAVYISVVSFWEIVIKKSIGRLVLPSPDFGSWVRAHVTPYSFAVLDVTQSHIEQLERVGFPIADHKDPFDRLLIAQAQAESMTLVSIDSKFGAYSVPVLW